MYCCLPSVCPQLFATPVRCLLCPQLFCLHKLTHAYNNSQLSPAAVQAVFAGLVHGRGTVTHINLVGNFLDDSSAKIIARALPLMPSLKELGESRLALSLCFFFLRLCLLPTSLYQVFCFAILDFYVCPFTVKCSVPLALINDDLNVRFAA